MPVRRSVHSLSGSIAVGTAIVAIAFIFWVLLTFRIEAHEAPAGWSYPLSCCSNFDCRELGAAEVRETAQGYLIVATGELVPYGDERIRQSPDGKFHWCAHQSGVDAGRTICLFVPPRGF